MPEREEGGQEIVNFFEKIMKENFLNLAKAMDFQEVQETQSPKEVVWKKALRNELFSCMSLAKGRATREELFTLTWPASWHSGLSWRHAAKN